MAAAVPAAAIVERVRAVDRGHSPRRLQGIAAPGDRDPLISKATYSMNPRRAAKILNPVSTFIACFNTNSDRECPAYIQIISVPLTAPHNPIYPPLRPAT